MRFLVALLAGVAALAIIVVLVSGSPAPSHRAAPALPRAVVAGAPVGLSGLRGHPALIDFFASWCGPCVAEARTVRRAAQALAGRARVVAVDWSDSRPSAVSFVRRYGWPFPVLYDPFGAAGYKYGIQGLPTAFVLDGDGRIRARLIGPQSLSQITHAVARVG